MFITRLVDLQIVEAQPLASVAVHRRSVRRTLSGARGEITDRNGVVLAEDVSRYNITAAPNAARPFTQDHQVVSVTKAMAEIAALTQQDVAGLLGALTAHPKSEFAYLVKDVDTPTYLAIVKLKIPYVYSEQVSGRSYPDGSVAGNLVGFVGTDGPQAGIEYADNTCLAGKSGSESYEVGADGVQIPGTIHVDSAARAGGTIATTLDANLQYQVQVELAQQATALGARSATAVVMKVSDASLLAVADYPSVDPNNVSATSAAYRGSKAFSDLYEPGSTMKALTAASLLDAGMATPLSEATVPDVRRFSWGGSVRDAESHPVEKLTLTGVLQNSSNVGIGILGERLSAQKRYDYMKSFGLGSPTAVGFPGEPRAALSPASKWDKQTNYNSMFGQGVAATALQLAGAYQTLANHGVREPVKLISRCSSASGTVTQEPKTVGTRVVSATAADETVAMLQNVLTAGTLGSMVPIPGYDLAAKTGTAQVADGPGGTYAQDFITSVAGILPAKNPQYVVVVTFTKPSLGKTSAAVAPAFRQITSDVLQTERVAPSQDALPRFAATW